MREEDRRTLWAFLVIYDAFIESGSSIPPLCELEDISKLARRAQELAVDLDRLAHADIVQAAMAHNLKWWYLLSEGLRRFGAQLSSEVDSMGEPGQKAKITAASHLVKASEFVKARLGTYCDEHLAELFQAIESRSRNLNDFTGDAIRKKRAYIRKNYPDQYRAAVEGAARL